MAQTRKRRQTKHRGNAAGMVEARGRTGRKPTDAERKTLAALLARQSEAFAAAPDEANALAGKKCPPGVEPARFAAWVIVSRVLLNLDETITRE